MNKKIKILFAINCMNIGGAPTVVFEQMKGIDKEKFDPYLLTLYPSKKANFFGQLDFLEEIKIKEFKLKNRSLFDIKTLFSIYKYLRKERFDIVYTHLFLANTIIRFCAVLARVPHIISFEHSMYFNKKKWQVIIDKILSFFTNKILVSTKSISDFTIKQEAINKDKFAIVPNPIFIPDRENVDIVEMRKMLGIPNDSFIIMTLGRFSEEKGYTFFLQAAAELVKKFPIFYFLIVGHGPLEKELRQEIIDRGLVNNCQLVIYPHKAKEFLFLGDVFVLPSLREGQSIVIYEAMMAALPVIASNVGGVKDILRDYQNGILINSGDYKEIADKIIELYKNPDLRNRLAKAGHDSVRGYNIKDIIDIFENLIINVFTNNSTKEFSNSVSYTYSSIFLKKKWFWFEDPREIENCAMVNFFSYNDIKKDGFNKKSSTTTVIELNKSLEDLWVAMRKSFVKKQIARGQKNGVEIVQDNNFKDFKKIYLSFRKEKRLAKDRYQNFVNNGILFSAYYNNKMIAGGVFIANNLYMRAWVLASTRFVDDGKMRDIVGQANRMIIWEAIKYAKKKNLTFFDLGGINPKSNEKSEVALMEFKESFGGKRIECFYYHKIYSKILRLLIKIKSLV